MKKPYEWDQYSDQPYPLKDALYKKTMRKQEFLSLIKTVFTSLIALPLSLVMLPFVKRKVINSRDFFCIGIDHQREQKETLKLIEELEVENILLRYKLWENHSLNELQKFIETTQKLRQKKITLKILQDREHIEDVNLLEKDLRTLFLKLCDSVNLFEIGTTINRAKWGFFSVNEYIQFYKVAYKLQQNEFPHIKLIGSGVIDFEYHFTSHTLFNFHNYYYDGVSSLLYVDRRGAPENMQLGFALSDKIALLSTMVWLSSKSAQKLYITEINWPIKGTAPYAPTSEYECVDLETHANYMLRYYLLAFASQQVDFVSWHQLIAPGYGLVDNRDGIKRHPAFLTFKFMYNRLKDAQFLRLDIKRGYYILQCLVDEQLLQIHWSLKPTTLKNEDFFEVYDRDGIEISQEHIPIGESPVYIYILRSVGEKINCL